MADSDTLFYAYAVGAAITIVLGFWLCYREDIKTPVLLTILTDHEYLVILFAVFWPILGPAVLLEIILRAWVRRRARATNMLSAASDPRPAPGVPSRVPGRNMKRALIFMACGLVFVIAATFLYFHGKKYHIIITQAQIDEALRARFPVSKTHLFIFRVTYSNPQVKLLPDSNRIEVGLDAELDFKLRGEAKRLGGSALVTSGLTYRNQTKQFFLSDPEIQKFSLQGVPQQDVDKVTAFASDAVRKYLQQFPIYTLRAKDAKTAAARLVLKDVEVKGTEVHVTLGF